MKGETSVRNPSPDAIAIVLTTLPGLDAGESLVRTLLDERLIACGNLVPGVHSIYRWEGEVVREEEVLVVFKTTSASAGLVLDRVVELHPYAVPEVIEIEAGRVSAAYRDWVLGSTKVIE